MSTQPKNPTGAKSVSVTEQSGKEAEAEAKTPTPMRAPSDAKSLPDPEQMTDQQLRHTFIHMLQREADREIQAKKHLERAEALAAEAQQRLEKEEKEASEAAKARMMKSVEVIKWCQLSVSAVMAVALLIMIITVKEVDREAKRIQAEVAEVQQEAERIYEKIRNPVELVSSFLTWQLRDSLGAREDKAKE